MNTYDFILAGAGTAGCVLAARLSSNSDLRVLLVEAGGEATAAMARPSAWPSLVPTAANWGESTVPQESAAGTVTPLPRGRAVGGSSSINAMVFARGHRVSYDAWVDAGAIGWGFDDLLPSFKRSESAPGRDPRLRGTDGPLAVAPADSVNPVLASCLDAAMQVGQRRATDISSGVEEGFAPVDLNVVNGRRQSAADAYLNPIRHRPNLHVVTGALVHRLLIEHGRCVGIEYSTGSQVRSASAAEVIVTAGAIGSAHLLLRSGIGPHAHLRAAGVDVSLDLPGVGLGLQDHPVANVIYRATKPIPAAQHNHGEVIGLVRSDPALTEPDLQLIFVDVPRRVPGMETPEWGYTIGVSVIRPHSRGSVRLIDGDPTTPPLLDPNYYADHRDLVAATAGLRLARRIGAASALDEWRDTEVTPGRQVADDLALARHARNTVASYCHPVGTCPIGEGTMSVVGPELRVHGVAGLRVADGSVMPSIPSANTNATVYAIAERAAELASAG